MSGAGQSGRVAIIGVGARTPVGLTADASAAAWRAGVSRLGFHPRFVDKAGEPMRAAFDARLDPDLPVAARMLEMATAAVQEACAGLATVGRPAASLLVGLPAPRPGWPELDTAPLLQRLSQVAAEFVNVQRVIPFAKGHASGLLALEAAARDIEAGTAEVCLVGGVDSWLDYRALAWLDAERRLASDANRLGFTPGEAAAFVLVTSVSVARAMQQPTLARIRGVGSAHEPNSLGTDTICVGEGLTAAIRNATAALRLPQEKIATAYCDINGERYRSEEFMYVPLRLWAPFVDSNRYDAPADSWGDVGAATGPLLVALAAVSGRRAWAKGEHVLVWASSDHGARGAVTLSLPVPAQGAAA
jgi:3-oxoacyl-[acyl-carrier-protein] synthase-1